MKFHIVRMGEKIDEILFLYELSKDELIDNNKHIKNWDRLVPGTKLKIPSISENADLEIGEMEPFIQDYYPRLEDVQAMYSSVNPNENQVNMKDLSAVYPTSQEQDDSTRHTLNKTTQNEENVVEKNNVKNHIEENEVEYEEDNNDEDYEDEDFEDHLNEVYFQQTYVPYSYPYQILYPYPIIPFYSIDDNKKKG